jgi:hypothetical protein
MNLVSNLWTIQFIQFSKKINYRKNYLAKNFNQTKNFELKNQIK